MKRMRMATCFMARTCAPATALLAATALSAALLSASAQAGSNQFTPVELYGGVTNHLVYHPTESRFVYAASPSGVYLSSDYGQNWILKGDGFVGTPSDIAVSADPHHVFVTVDDALFSTQSPEQRPVVPEDSFPGDTAVQAEFSADGRVVAAAAETRVYRSTDLGATWQTGGELDGDWGPILTLHVDPDDAQTLYVATGLMALRSPDGGATWEEIEGDFLTAFDIGVSRDDENDVSLLWIASAEGVWVRVNEGAFTFIANGAFSRVFPIPDAPYNMYAIDPNTGLYIVHSNADAPDPVLFDVYTG